MQEIIHRRLVVTVDNGDAPDVLVGYQLVTSGPEPVLRWTCAIHATIAAPHNTNNERRQAWDSITQRCTTPPVPRRRRYTATDDQQLNTNPTTPFTGPTARWSTPRTLPILGQRKPVQRNVGRTTPKRLRWLLTAVGTELVDSGIVNQAIAEATIEIPAAAIAELQHRLGRTTGELDKLERLLHDAQQRVTAARTDLSYGNLLAEAANLARYTRCREEARDAAEQLAVAQRTQAQLTTELETHLNALT